jgi:hypothetical protein
MTYKRLSPSMIRNVFPTYIDHRNSPGYGDPYVEIEDDGEIWIVSGDGKERFSVPLLRNANELSWMLSQAAKYVAERNAEVWINSAGVTP